jgi:hypothetical protein
MTIKKAGNDEGHPAPSQEPHGWASFFRHHRTCHGYRTSRAQSGSGYLTFGQCAGMSPQQPAAMSTVSMAAASWVLLPPSAPSSTESTRALLLLLASKI